MPRTPHPVGYLGTPEQRFWRKVQKGDGCWLWTGHVDAKGYGRFQVAPRQPVTASRFAYELTHGPIPQGEGYHGLCVMHVCDNPQCVRPDHLRLGTQKDNIRDAARKGRIRGQFSKKREVASASR